MKTELIYEMENERYNVIEDMSYDEYVEFFMYGNRGRSNRSNDSYNEYTENETYYN